MRRTGLLMMIAGWLLLAGLIWWVMGGALERRENPNARLAEVTSPRAEIVLQRGRDGHYRAPGRINGHAVDFLVDTGATQVAIPLELAKAMGLRAGKAFQAQTASGLTLAYATRLDSVSLGGLEARDVSGTLIASKGAEEVLLGMSFLSRFDIAIRAGEMTLRAH
ncbi:MAG: TIGR02281 family clan AA aspartic protease [Pseudomonadota bacterium]|nr:TIGR02281 family clan AA aspartic protease [Pseudomonadota bacterium]MDP1906291.1 TIGR02281 family clan AA aspartic protease [Pseudomonadota bacterium]MDP2351658.1 TIGR02281 family clan AA aspartic protease [Pseudomonadota bacterium]